MSAHDDDTPIEIPSEGFDDRLHDAEIVGWVHGRILSVPVHAPRPKGFDDPPLEGLEHEPMTEPRVCPVCSKIVYEESHCTQMTGPAADEQIIVDALSNLQYPTDAYAALNRMTKRLRWFESKYPAPYEGEIR